MGGSLISNLKIPTSVSSVQNIAIIKISTANTIKMTFKFTQQKQGRKWIYLIFFYEYLCTGTKYIVNYLWTGIISSWLLRTRTIYLVNYLWTGTISNQLPIYKNYTVNYLWTRTFYLVDYLWTWSIYIVNYLWAGTIYIVNYLWTGIIYIVNYLWTGTIYI